MSKSAAEQAYWGDVKVTPEREQAWQLWKDNYLASCVETWNTQGATQDDVAKSAAVVLHDLGAVDGLPWMPLGTALLSQLAAATGAKKSVDGSDKTDFINSLRTAKTSQAHDRVLCIAYQLGISPTEAAKYGDGTHVDMILPEESTGAECALYRHFDESGSLLYVGIANNPGVRDEQHGRTSKWHRFVCATTVEWFPTRTDAARAERLAIAGESPIFNQTHNKKNRDAAVNYLFDALSFAAVTPAPRDAEATA